MKRASTRFGPSIWTRIVIPVILGLLFLALVTTVIYVLLFTVGMI